MSADGPVVALVDYGAGNLASVRKALAHLGAAVRDARTPADLDGAAAILVPGVGHFQATVALDEPWRRAVGALVANGVPLVGICLGMQWLFEGSAEAPEVPGLGLLPGRAARLDGDVKVPHVGWNALAIARTSWLLAGVPDGAQAYFTHSYAAPVTADCAATTTHGVTFASAVERNGVAGVQFHPEKSGDAGLRILRNFLDRAAGR